MCIFQVHLISTNSNLTGEEATLRWNRAVQCVEVSRSSPVENLSSLYGGCGPQQLVECQDFSGMASKETVEVHILLCHQSLHYQCLHRVKRVLCEAKKGKVHTPRIQSGCCEEVDWSIFEKKRHNCVPQPDQSHRLVQIVGAKRRCRWCSKQQIRRETVYACISGNIHLCKNGCFVKYHNHHSFPFEHSNLYVLSLGMSQSISYEKVAHFIKMYTWKYYSQVGDENSLLNCLHHLFLLNITIVV